MCYNQYQACLKLTMVLPIISRGKESKSKASVFNEGCDMSISALSRQLVHCKLAEADAQRKLRVSGRWSQIPPC